MTQFWSRQNEPMELMEWAMAYEDTATRIVAVDSDGPEADMVSTIWEGMARPLSLHDEEFARDHFETALVRDGKVVHAFRSSSEEEALAIHAEWCTVYLGRPPRPEDGHVQTIIERDEERKSNG